MPHYPLTTSDTFYDFQRPVDYRGYDDPAVASAFSRTYGDSG